MSDEVTPAEHSQMQRKSDAALLDLLSNEADDHCARTKHVLQALITAAVPLDMTTAEILVQLGHNMHAFIHSACSEE
jgi:hypothetical protein